MSTGRPRSQMLDEHLRARWAQHTALLRARLAGDPSAIEPEQVHRARVALRHLRSDLRLFADAIVAGSVDGLAQELRWLSGELGVVRDLDVLGDLVGELLRERGQDPGPLVQEIVRRRGLAAGGLAAALAGGQADRLLTELDAHAAGPPTRPAARRIESREALPRGVHRAWRRLERSVDAAGDHPTDDALHRVRILAKRARYGAEACAESGIADAAALEARLGALQDHLGRHHDRVVAAAWMLENGPRLESQAAFSAGGVALASEIGAEQLAATWRPLWRRAVRRRPHTWR